MRMLSCRIFFLLLLGGPLSIAAFAQAPAREDWVVTTDLWGNPVYQTLALARDGDRVTGAFDSDALVGTLAGGTLRFVATDEDGSEYRYRGRIAGDTLSGTADLPDPNHPDRRATHAFKARRILDRPAGPPVVHTYVPRDYANEFSPHRAPVLTIRPGDIVRTTTVDSGGVDETGTTRALFGNPQTGPFYVATADIGDTLVVRIRRLRLNRTYADSLDDIVGRARGTSLAAEAATLGKPVRWTLDTARGVARPETPSAGLKHFSVPLRPMLGGLAVAPGFGSAPISTGDSGRFGGNMDVNEIVEGNTVYLPVFQPGALLYLGDAHALQGDGETSQYALETSMAVEFSVEVLHDRPITMPRIESPTQIMVLGQAGSLDDALRAATTGMTQWLAQAYGLTLSESAQVLGSSVRYEVANLAGRNVGILAKLDKARLEGLSRATPL
jgi:amidase